MSKRRSGREKNLSAGLPQVSKSAPPLDSGHVVIGKFRRPHGVKGDMLFEVMTDFPERIVKGMHIFVGKDLQEKVITNVRNHHVGFIMHIEGYETPEEVGVLRNLMTYVPIEVLPSLPDGEIYHHQLLGMKVMTAEGELLGTLTEIMETGANDVLIIHDEAGKEVLLPDIESVVLGIDSDKEAIIVQLQEWL